MSLGHPLAEAQPIRLHSPRCRYETLATHYPNVPEYKLYWCQSLYKAGMFAEASRGAAGVDGFAQAVRLLHCAIKYEQDDLQGCRAALEAFSPSDPTATVNLGCVQFKEGQYAAALDQFSEATQVGAAAAMRRLCFWDQQRAWAAAGFTARMTLDLPQPNSFVRRTAM